MLGWLKRRLRVSSDADMVCSQLPGEVFPWPKGTVLTAIDEVVFALPIAMFDKDQKIGDVVFGPDDMEINIPLEGDTFFVRIRPGMSVSLAKSCQSYVVAKDNHSRRVKVRKPLVEA